MNASEQRATQEMGGEIAEILRATERTQLTCWLGFNGCHAPLDMSNWYCYPHPAGLTDSEGNTWWLYLRCDTCGYEYAAWKVMLRVGIPDEKAVLAVSLTDIERVEEFLKSKGVYASGLSLSALSLLSDVLAVSDSKEQDALVRRVGKLMSGRKMVSILGALDMVLADALFQYATSGQDWLEKLNEREAEIRELLQVQQFHVASLVFLALEEEKTRPKKKEALR